MTLKSAVVLVFSQDGRVLAVSRKDNPNDFGLPGGKLEDGESEVEGANRELEEETGLQAFSLQRVFADYFDDGFCTCFIAKVFGEISTKESGVVKWVEPVELIKGSFGSYNEKLFASLDFAALNAA